MFDVESHVPVSVRDYLSNDPGVRSVRMAVDSLLDHPLDQVPKSLAWEELGDFYRARAAAELTKIEWSTAVKNIWQHVWGNNMGPGWKIGSVDELFRNQIIAIEECWEESCFCVVHYCRDLEFYTAIQLQSDEITIFFSLEKSGKPLIREGVDGFNWSGKKTDWEDWNMAVLSGNLCEQPDVIDAASAAARNAITARDRF